MANRLESSALGAKETRQKPSSGMMRGVTITATMIAALFAAEHGTAQAQEPFSYDQIKTLQKHLGSSDYSVRDVASKTLASPEKKDQQFTMKNAIWLAPGMTHPDLEVSRRVKTVMGMHTQPLRQKHFPLPDDGNHWIDGINYVPKVTQISIPEAVSGGKTDCNGEIINWYRKRSYDAGVTFNLPPRYAVDHKAYECMADDQMQAVVGKALYKRTHKDVAEWQKKNPDGDVGEWLVTEFEKETKQGLDDLYPFLGSFKEGSNGYRKVHHFPLEAPPDKTKWKFPELSRQKFGPLDPFAKAIPEFRNDATSWPDSQSSIPNMSTLKSAEARRLQKKV